MPVSIQKLLTSIVSKLTRPSLEISVVLFTGLQVIFGTLNRKLLVGYLVK